MCWLLQTVTCGIFSDVTTRLKSCGIRTKWSIFCSLNFVFSQLSIWFSFNFYLIVASRYFGGHSFFLFNDHLKLFISSFYLFYYTTKKSSINSARNGIYKNKIDCSRTTWLFHLTLSTSLSILDFKITNILPWPSKRDGKYMNIVHTVSESELIPAILL